MAISDANDISMIKYDLQKRQITSNQHTNKRKTDSSDMNDHNVSLKVAKVGSDNMKKPPFPTTQKINELKELMEAPIPHPVHSYHSGSHNSPPSPTTKKMEEFHKLITAPPTAEELRQREHTSSSSSSTTLTSSQASNSDPVPFSKEVIRRGPRHTMPIGYRSNKNTIALSAETFIKQRKTNKPEVALRMAREKLENKKANDKATRQEWREMAAIDPEKAGKRKQQVPKGLSKELYIPARAHQLHFRGKVKTVEEGRKLAQLEQDKVAADARKRDAKRRAKAKQP